MKTPVLYSQFCCAVMILKGCASSRVNHSQCSGFLKDYRRLQSAESASGAPVMRWIDPQVSLSNYIQVYIEPRRFYAKPQPSALISAQTLQALTR